MKKQRTKQRKANHPDKPQSTEASSTSGPHVEFLGRNGLLLLCLLSFLLSLPLFAPWSLWPFGYVVFVPWLVGISAAGSRRWAYLGSYLLGAAFFLFHFRWLYETTGAGFVASSLLYLAFAFPVAAWPVRHLYRFRGVGLTFVFPVVWTGIEILRTYNPLGFPWFLLGHSQIRALPVVQIADLAGVYGVTFVVAMVNGFLADLVLARLARRGGRKRTARPGLAISGCVAAGLVVANLGYGAFRLAQADFTEGPTTAVLQGDFLLAAVRDDPKAATDRQKERIYLQLLSRAVAERPDIDLIVLPETPWGMYLNREFRQARPKHAYMNQRWVELTEVLGKSIVTGAMSEEPQPAGTYPPQHRYNSAFLYTPGDPEPQRYDKMHLVPFGEYVPFRYSKYFHFIYRFFAFGPWNPWGRDGFEYSLTPGDEFTVMKLPRAESGTNGRFGVTICYEDVIPRIFRKFVYDAEQGKRVDFMLNISNDGWFGHGTQQAQHLVNCAFRAIENRVCVARAVNTGISGFVDPDGSWRDLVQEQGRMLHAGGKGFSVARVKLDPRISLYSRIGDLFGFVCLVLVGMVAADSALQGYKRRSARRARRASEGIPGVLRQK